MKVSNLFSLVVLSGVTCSVLANGSTAVAAETKVSEHEDSKVTINIKNDPNIPGEPGETDPSAYFGFNYVPEGFMFEGKTSKNAGKLTLDNGKITGENNKISLKTDKKDLEAKATSFQYKVVASMPKVTNTKTGKEVNIDSMTLDFEKVGKIKTGEEIMSGTKTENKNVVKTSDDNYAYFDTNKINSAELVFENAEDVEAGDKFSGKLEYELIASVDFDKKEISQIPGN